MYIPVVLVVRGMVLLGCGRKTLGAERLRCRRQHIIEKDGTKGATWLTRWRVRPG